MIPSDSFSQWQSDTDKHFGTGIGINKKVLHRISLISRTHIFGIVYISSEHGLNTAKTGRLDTQHNDTLHNDTA